MADLKKHRRSIRLNGYDYSQNGMYFITVCSQKRQCIFGEIVDEVMVLNHLGHIVYDLWQWLGEQYHYIDLDEFVVMPNHIHGIIMINNLGASRSAPTIKPLGRLIGAFKTVSTKKINTLCQTSGDLIWQRNYYEHVIRDEQDLNRLREYIDNNPCQWSMDENNPDRYEKK